MKKLIATISLGTLLVVGGFLFSQNAPSDTAMEIEPSIFSIGHSVF